MTFFAFGAIAIAVLLSLGSSAQAQAPRRALWQPTPTSTPWQWQLQGKIDVSVPATVYEVDGFETPASTVRRLHRRGRKVICYLDVGSWESYRPDKGSSRAR